MQHLFAKITFTLESESVRRFHRNLSLSALGVGETVDIIYYDKSDFQQLIEFGDDFAYGAILRVSSCLICDE